MKSRPSGERLWDFNLGLFIVFLENISFNNL
jgi:hypothetical protein